MKRLFSLILVMGMTLSLAPPSSALELEDAKELLETYYVNELPEGYENMTSLDELLTAINDPYTDYLTAEEYQHLLSSVNGESLVGIGISLQTTYHDGFKILQVFPNSPAQKAGLKAGDVIVSVDRVPLTADSDPAKMIQGREGTRIVLTVRDADTGLASSKILIRSKVLLPIVSSGMNGNALVISCDSFGESTPNLVRDAILEHEAEASVCIMDLRSNPGGTSTSAAGTAGIFLGGPQVICYFRDAADDYTAVTTKSKTSDLTDMPLVILTDPYAASASELFSAAIRDHGAGIAIGQRTFGKGIAQYILDHSTHPEFFDNDALKVTVYRFFSPDGATNDTIGVLPTLVISPENAPAAALMLDGTPPVKEESAGWLMLEVGGQVFYIDAERALSENIAAFCELLESLPPSAVLYKSNWPKVDWEGISPAQIAGELGLTRGVDYNPRVFCDCDTSPYAEEIHTLSAYQLISGDGNGSFRPNDTITRAEFCAMVSSALALPAASTGPFSDVAGDAWYAGAVNAMSARGFISGYGDHTFRPNATISYEEMVTILANVSVWACMEGFDYAKLPQNQFTLETYAAFSDWSLPGARILDLFGALLRSEQPFAPGTRGAAAATLCRLMNGAGLLWN